MKTTLIAIILLFNSVSAMAKDAHNDNIMTVYIQYYTAKAVANICEQTSFSNEEEEKKYNNNFVFVKNSLKSMLKRLKADATGNEVDAHLIKLNTKMDQSLALSYSENGCDNEIIKDALVWNENFKKMPPAPSLN